MTDYEALIKEARTPSNPGDVTSPRWVGGRGDLITRLADAVETLVAQGRLDVAYARVEAFKTESDNFRDQIKSLEAERDALRAQLDGMTTETRVTAIELDHRGRARVGGSRLLTRLVGPWVEVSA